MPDIEINIASPQLQAGEKFKIRYRTLPGGSFGAYQDKTSNTFTFAGLSAGDYEIEYVFVKADASECPTVVSTFTVVPEYECVEFNAEVVQSGGLYYLSISYPTITNNPPCGWRIREKAVGGGGSTTTHTTLPSSPINYPMGVNTDMELTITALLCNGKEVVCFNEIIPKVAEPECDGMVVNSYALDYRIFTSHTQWSILLDTIQSTPPTNPITVHYQEISQVPAGITPDSGSVQLPFTIGPGTPVSWSITTLFPKGIFLTVPGQNPDLPPEYIPNCIRYSVSFIDKCGEQHAFDVWGQWVPGSQPGIGTFTPWGC